MDGVVRGLHSLSAESSPLTSFCVSVTVPEDEIRPGDAAAGEHPVHCGNGETTRPSVPEYFGFFHHSVAFFALTLITSAQILKVQKSCLEFCLERAASKAQISFVFISLSCRRRLPAALYWYCRLCTSFNPQPR